MLSGLVSGSRMYFGGFGGLIFQGGGGGRIGRRRGFFDAYVFLFVVPTRAIHVLAPASALYHVISYHSPFLVHVSF